MIAPSGKFCIAMPSASVNAPAIVICVSPKSAPAKVTPTAIPSGILCNVTANTIIVVFLTLVFMPSGLSVSRCKCGITLSKSSKNAIPKINPTAAGIHATFPCSAAMSIAGMRSDHTEAATITPAANPINNFSIFLFIWFLMKKTIAEPSVVPIKGIITPAATLISMLFSPFFFIIVYDSSF